MKPAEFVARRDWLAYEDRWWAMPDRKEWLAEWIGRDQRVLDVGCLGGRIAEWIRSQRNEVVGVELNPEAARLASERGLRVVTANVEEGIPLADASFDVVHAGQILESLFDTRAFLGECRRVLRPGGQLLVLVRNVSRIDNRLRVLLGGYPAGMGAYPEDHDGERLRVFNPSKLSELLASAGFEIEETRGLLGDLPQAARGDAEAQSLNSRWWVKGLRLGSRVAPGLAPWVMVRARRPESPRAGA